MAKLTKRENQARLGPGKENTIFLQALIWAMRGEHRCESRVFFLEEEEETIRRVRRARQWLQEEKSPVTFRNLIRAVSALFPHEAEALLSGTENLAHGTLTVGADSPTDAMELLAGLRTRFPGLGLKITMGNMESVLADLRDYRVDAALLSNDAFPAPNGRSSSRRRRTMTARRDDAEEYGPS